MNLSCPTEPPLLSYIILVYNYRSYVVEAIRSVLEQTIQDFEIVVVDDASADDSAEVVRSFTDTRIRLLHNERNMGGGWSYNRAVTAARGKYLVNLDADDWVEPDKAEKQLEAFSKDPQLDIIGTYIRAIDKDGQRHPDAMELESHCNRPLDLNAIDSWIVQNPLCRSSTMMRRDTHLRIGLDDPTIVYTCDFELWTRALREGCKFTLLPEVLCNYRWHGGNITHKDPRIQLIEIIYLLAQNVVPAIEQRATYVHLSRVLMWFANHEEAAKLHPRARYRLVASLFRRPPEQEFAAFRDRILAADPDRDTEMTGRRCLALFQRGAGGLMSLAHDLETQRLHIALEHYMRQTTDWEQRYRKLEQEIAGPLGGGGNDSVSRAPKPGTVGKRRWLLQALQDRG
jgi:glycosyltransferase involved in cell wall biosynthesis